MQQPNAWQHRAPLVTLAAAASASAGAGRPTGSSRLPPRDPRPSNLTSATARPNAAPSAGARPAPRAGGEDREEDEHARELPIPFASPVALVDIGANLAHASYRRDVDAVVGRAVAAGVRQMVITGTSVRGSREGLEIAKRRPGVLFSTAGVHPHDAKSFDATTLAALERIASDPACVSIGEAGLDYNRDFSPREAQREAFAKQVELAVRLGKPLFVHEREAHADLLRILQPFQGRLPPLCVHCFTGTREELQEYVRQGFYIGVTGFIAKKNRGKELRSFIADVPLNRLMVETDCPFMLGDDKETSPYRRRNEPCTLPFVVRAIANASGREYDVVAAETTKAARTFFGLPDA